MSEASQKDEAMFGCGECFILFKEPDYTKKYFYRHAIKSFSCKECDAKFSLKNNLKCHLSTHTDCVSPSFKLSIPYLVPVALAQVHCLLSVVCVVLHSVELVI